MKHLRKYVAALLALLAYAGALISCCPDASAEDKTLPILTYRVVRSYPHDTGAFTQGLAFDRGKLFEGTGRRGRSSLRRVDLETGIIKQEYRLPSNFFGEGITVVGDRIIQLTWKAGTGFVYDRESFALLETFRYPGDGWGLTHDGKHLIMSDGTPILRFLDPVTFQEFRQIRVVEGSVPLTALNELEYVDGMIYANVWFSDRVAIINPVSGQVTAWIDLAGLLETPRAEPGDVLNGIAFDRQQKKLYVTGKLWPKLFEIEVTGPKQEPGGK